MVSLRSAVGMLTSCRSGQSPNALEILMHMQSAAPVMLSFYRITTRRCSDSDVMRLAGP